MADGILGGLSDFFLNQGRYADPNAVNERFGVPEQDVRQAGINTLANVSSLLLAAGQPMTGTQRAQLLSGIGPALGGMQSDIFKASQARLMNAQQRGALQEQQELAAISERRQQDPDGLARDMGIDVGRVRSLPAKALADIARSITVSQASRTPESRQLERLQLQQAERKLREPTIFRVGNQAYRFDEQGTPVLVGPSRDYGFGEIETPTTPPPGAGMMPPDAARPPGAPPAAAPAQAEQNRFANINRDVDYNRAFGLSGAFNWAAGKVRGVVGSEDASTQEAGKAISEINTLRNSLISATSAEVAGKNLKSTQQRIQELLPTPAAVFTSPAEAVNKFSSVRQLIEADMNDLLFIGSERSGASEADKVRAAQAYRDLRRNRDNINVVIDSIAGPATPAQARPGRSQQFREGQTAINPQTGERRVFRGGRWEVM